MAATVTVSNDSATLTTQDDGQVNIAMVRGDSVDLLMTLVDDAAAALDLSKATDGTAARPAILRASVKADPDNQKNSEAIVFKTSQVPSDITVLPQNVTNTKGKAKVFIDKPDTETTDTTQAYRWDLEVTRQDTVRTSAGTITLSPGGGVVGAGTSFTSAKRGDVLQPLGTNSIPAIVVSVADDTHMVVDFAGYSAEAGAAFELRRGHSNTVLRGAFNLLSGVVAQ